MCMFFLAPLDGDTGASPAGCAKFSSNAQKPPSSPLSTATLAPARLCAGLSGAPPVATSLSK
jgi:hypothetical protein